VLQENIEISFCNSKFHVVVVMIDVGLGTVRGELWLEAERGFGATARSTVRLTNPYREDRAHRAWHFVAHICSAGPYL
jgi:hypothetical protein